MIAHIVCAYGRFYYKTGERTEEPQQIVAAGHSTDLNYQLALSEDSDDDEEVVMPIMYQTMLSPIAATPAANRMEDIPQILPPIVTTQEPPQPQEDNQADSSSSSSSDSGSGSDSDSSSDDSDNEKEETTPVEQPQVQVQPPPVVPTPPPTFENDAEEHKKRWNLASYMVSENKDTIPAPLSPISSGDRSNSNDSVKSHKFKNGLPSSASSDNCSDVSDIRNTLKDANKIVTRRSDDSDSDDDRTSGLINKPQQKKRTTSMIYNSDSDSDFQVKKVKTSPTTNKQSVPTDVAKPKSNRGRPRKIKPEETENGEVKAKKRGRPKLPKNELKSKQRTSSVSDADVQVKKRGRPKKKRTSSSDEEPKSKTNKFISSDDESQSRSSSKAHKLPRTEDLSKSKGSKDDQTVKSSTSEKAKDKPNAPFKRKSTKKPLSRTIKSSETVPTSDSDSDDEKPRRNISDSDLSDSGPSKTSSKDKKITTPKKEEKEKDKDRVQDKNKSDFLRRLYTPKRDSEGGKGGGKGGAKGGKGKGGVSVFIKDESYDRNASSITEESLFSADPISPLRSKSDNAEPNKQSSSSKHTAEDSSKNKPPSHRNEFKIFISLGKVDLTKKEKEEQTKKLSKDKERENRSQDKHDKTKEEGHKSRKSSKSKESHHKSKDVDKTSKDKHLKTKEEKDRKSKEKDQKSKEKRHKSKENEHKSKDKSSKHSKDNKDDSKHKSKRKKRDRSRSSSRSEKSDKSNKIIKPEEPPAKRTKVDSEKSSKSVNNTNIHPTNHERISHSEKKDNSKSSSKKESSKEKDNTPKEKDSSSHVKKEHTNQEKIPQVETQKSSSKAASTSQQKIVYSNDQTASTSNDTSDQRVAYSYFEPFEEPQEFDSRDHNQYLVEAKRLKHYADTVTDPMNQCLLYMDAVLYFLLTGDAMECGRNAEAAAFTMFRDTLSLIKYISERYKQQHLFSKLFTTLAVLNYRCQSRLYYKLLEIKRRENKEHQKVIAEYFNKNVAVPSEMPPNPTTAQPNATSPVSPSGSVGSIGSHSSSGYSSSDLPSRNQGMWVPMQVHNAISVQNQHFTYLLTYMDLWETADNLVQNAGLTDFFIALDRTCRPLTLHSTIRHLVTYVKRGIMLVQKEMQDGST